MSTRLILQAMCGRAIQCRPTHSHSVTPGSATPIHQRDQTNNHNVGWSISQRPGWRIGLQTTVLLKTGRTSGELYFRLDRINEDASDGVTPVSLREVARQLRVSVGALRYHAPMVASKLVERSERYRRTTQAQKDDAVIRAVLDGVRSWSAESVTPIAKKPLLRMLRKKTGLPKEKLRKAIQRLLRDQVA